MLFCLPLGHTPPSSDLSMSQSMLRALVPAGWHRAARRPWHDGHPWPSSVGNRPTVFFSGPAAWHQLRWQLFPIKVAHDGIKIIWCKMTQHELCYGLVWLMRSQLAELEESWYKRMQFRGSDIPVNSWVPWIKLGPNGWTICKITCS